MDEYFKETRGTGAFQKRLAFIIIATSVPAGVQVMLSVFLTYTPPHHCDVTMYNTTNTSMSNLSSFIPLDKNGELDQCKMYTNMTNNYQSDMQGKN